MTPDKAQLGVHRAAHQGWYTPLGCTPHNLRRAAGAWTLLSLFLPQILARRVVFVPRRLLIQCTDKGWQNARRAGNIVPRKPESEHQDCPPGLPYLFPPRCHGTRRCLPGHHVSTLEVLSALPVGIKITMKLPPSRVSPEQT